MLLNLEHVNHLDELKNSTALSSLSTLLWITVNQVDQTCSHLLMYYNVYTLGQSVHRYFTVTHSDFSFNAAIAHSLQN